MSLLCVTISSRPSGNHSDSTIMRYAQFTCNSCVLVGYNADMSCTEGPSKAWTVLWMAQVWSYELCSCVRSSLLRRCIVDNTQSARCLSTFRRNILPSSSWKKIQIPIAAHALSQPTRPFTTKTTNLNLVQCRHCGETEESHNKPRPVYTRAWILVNVDVRDLDL